MAWSPSNGQVIGASALSGLLEGLAQGQQNKQKNALAQQEMQMRSQLYNQRAKNEATTSSTQAAENGLSIDPTTGIASPDPDYYTAGTPANSRAKLYSQLKNPQSQKTPTTYGDLAALTGQPLPAGKDSDDELDTGLANTYAKSKLAVPKPNDQPANPALVKLYESKYGPGSAQGLTTGDIAKWNDANVAGGFKTNTGFTVRQAYGAKGIPIPPELQNDPILDQPLLEGAKSLVEPPKTPKSAMSGALDDVNKAQAKDFSDFNSGSGSSRVAAQNNIAKLDALADSLENHNSGMFGGAVRFMGDSATNAYDPELAQIRDSAQKQAALTVKSVIGGRPAQQEYMKQLGFAYNPQLAPNMNAQRLRQLSAELKSQLAQRSAENSYFGKNGTMGTPGGGIYSAQPTMRSSLYDTGDEDLNDLGPNSGPTADPRALRGKAAQAGGVAVNGNIIPGKQVAQMQSFPTKGTASAPKDGAVVRNPKDGKMYKRNGGRWFPVQAGEATE